jgi:hypothetical protein
LLKVIYAPQKAVKEIAANPTYLAPFLILVLFIGANVGLVYISSSKTYFEQTLPNGLNHDVWTENQTFWTSNANISESSDAITVNYTAGARPYYGTKSIAFSMNDSSEVSMELNNIGPINCSVPDGYDKLDFRVKQLSPSNYTVSDATLYLFSTNSSTYFYLDLTQNFSVSTFNEWNNLTNIQLDSGWNNNSQYADWSNINGFELDLTWPAVSNISVLVDGLFFHGPYQSSLETLGGSYLYSVAFSYALTFLITWVILGGILYLFSRGLGAKLTWKPLLIVIGCILITMVVQAVVNAAAWGTLSTINVPFALEGGVPGEGQAAYNAILSQTRFVSLTGTIMQLVTYVWTIALAGVAVHQLGEFRWSRSFLAATVAYFVTLLIVGVLFG